MIDNIEILKQLDFDKQLTFAYLTCERLYPNYLYFSRNYFFGNAKVLRNAIDFIKLSLFSQQDRMLVDFYLKEIELSTPTPGHFDTIFESSSLDACTVISSTLDFMIDKTTIHLEAISTYATDTVDMYVAETENLDFNTNKDFNKKIFDHPLMQRELATQNGIITYLSKIQEVGVIDIDFLLELQLSKTKSNLDIEL